MVNSVEEMSKQIIDYFNGVHDRQSIRESCRKRSSDYQAKPIMKAFLENMALTYDDSLNSGELVGRQLQENNQTNPIDKKRQKAVVNG